MAKVKLVATLGPSSWSEETMKRMVAEGVNAFRLNFSHVDYARFEELAKQVRRLETPLRPLTLIADLQGPVIRLGELAPFQVRPGDRVTFTLSSKTEEKYAVPVPNGVFFEIVREGDEVLVEGGRLAFRIVDAGPEKAVGEALLEGEVKPRKTVTVRGKDIPLPTITEKDLRDIEFSVKAGFDAIALSFVRSSSDVQRLRDILFDYGAEDVKIIAKIETKSAVEDLDSILQKSDAVLVARGDLANFYGLEEIYSIQRYIISRARRFGKPSIVATQLLESMISNPLPTRSEVVDVITAVRMGADALLLAGETAAGKYPVESVYWLRRIVEEAEREPLEVEDVAPDKSDLYESIAKGVVSLAEVISGKIIAFSEKGNTARRISKFRPKAGLIVFTNDPATARYVNMIYGVRVVYDPSLSKADQNLFSKMLSKALEHNLVNLGDLVVFTSGRRRGSTDLVSVERVKSE